MASLAASGEMVSPWSIEVTRSGIPTLMPWIGLPGTVGGAVVGNAGCFGLETSRIYSNQPRYSTSASIHDKFANVIVSKSLNTSIVILFLSLIQNSLFYRQYLISLHRIMIISMRGFIVRQNNRVDEVVVHSSRIHHPNMLALFFSLIH